MNRFSHIIDKIATRPIHIDRDEVLKSMNRLLEYIERRWGWRPKESIGESHSFRFEDKIKVKATDGSEFEILVQYKCRDSDSWEMVIGGGSGTTANDNKPAIVIILNGNNTYNMMFTTTSGERFRTELMEVLMHEITHNVDIFKKRTDTKTQNVPSRKDLTEEDLKKYVNEESEVRATMRSVYEEVLSSLPNIHQYITINSIMKNLAYYSSTWEDRKEYLTEANKKLILKGVFQAINDWIGKQKQEEINEQNRKMANRLINSSTDEEYLKAIESKDMDKAQKMVDEAAKSKGYNIHLWHGGEMDAEVMREHEHGAATYAVDRKSEAAKYGEVHAVVAKGKILNGEGKPTQGFISDFVDAADSLGLPITNREIELAQRPATIHISIQELYNKFPNRRDDANEVLNVMGYSGETYGEESTAVSYAFFDRSAIKSADVISYDNAGKIISLSKRFNSGSNDIRY